MKDLAEELDYGEWKWDYPGYYEDIEDTSFAWQEDIDVLEQMGFNQYTWDCWINHYSDYTWEELECFGLDSAYMKLGWSKETWDSWDEDDWPEQEFTNWTLLYEEEQIAATELCYFPELWDQIPLEDWDSGWEYHFTPTVSLSPSVEPTSSPSSSPTATAQPSKSSVATVVLGNVFEHTLGTPAKISSSPTEYGAASLFDMLFEDGDNNSGSHADGDSDDDGDEDSDDDDSDDAYDDDSDDDNDDYDDDGNGDP